MPAVSATNEANFAGPKFAEKNARKERKFSKYESEEKEGLAWGGESEEDGVVTGKEEKTSKRKEEKKRKFRTDSSGRDLRVDKWGLLGTKQCPDCFCLGRI